MIERPKTNSEWVGEYDKWNFSTKYIRMTFIWGWIPLIWYLPFSFLARKSHTFVCVSDRFLCFYLLVDLPVCTHFLFIHSLFLSLCPSLFYPSLSYSLSLSLCGSLCLPKLNNTPKKRMQEQIGIFICTIKREGNLHSPVLYSYRNALDALLKPRTESSLLLRRSLGVDWAY